MFFNIFNNKKREEFTNFFDYPAKKRKRIIVDSAKKGAKLQLALIKRYEEKYHSRQQPSY